VANALHKEGFDHISKEGRRRRPGIIRSIQNKIIIVVSPKTTKTKTTSLLTSR
jgi:hypothetical protein